MILSLSKDDEIIISNLIKEKIISENDINFVKEKEQKKILEQKKYFFDKCYLVDLQEKKIFVSDTDFKVKKELIQIKGSFNLNDWNIIGNTIHLFDTENKKIDDINQSIDYKYGLFLKNGKFYIHKDNIEDFKFLANSNIFIFPAISKSKLDSLPFDIYASNNYLVITNRAEGLLYIIDTNKEELIKTFNIRPNGNNKCINVCIAEEKNKIFVTDNQTTNLHIIDLNNLNLETKNLSIGLLGNICLSHDSNYIYCLTLKPKQILKLININDFSTKKEFALKGELFSISDYPYDLLINLNNMIYLMTHIPDPEPFTPVITIIDSGKEKAIQRFSIKNKKSLIVCLGEENKIFSKKSIIDLLLENKIILQNDIDNIKNKSNSSNIEDFGINNFKVQNNILDTISKKERKDEEIEWKINKTPNKIGFENITPGIEEEMIKKCKEQILKDYEKKITEQSEIEKWEEAQNKIEKMYLAFKDSLNNKNNYINIRLKDAVSKARQELEWFDISIIRLKELLENYHFEIMFSREEVLEMIRVKERNELIETGLKTIESNCPNCEAPLLGSYTCRMCGFELEKPEDSILKKMTMIGSFEHLQFLKHGHLIIPDVINHDILEIDHFRKVIWEVKKDVLRGDVEIEFDKPRDAIRLKNNITLICDSSTNRVVKITQKGKIYWEFNTNAYNENKLNSPVSVTAFESGNVAIVDQGNHRVIEVDEDSNIVWQYGNGKPGIDEGQLDNPSFYQKTAIGNAIITDSGNNRVIEIENNKIVWQYGDTFPGNRENQLNNPVSAWRFDNGNTLIMDAGNYRVIEVNPHKQIVWEFKLNYKPDEIGIPLRANRTKTGKIIVFTEKKVIEIDYGTSEITWESNISDLVKGNIEIKTFKQNIEKSKVKYGVSNPFAKSSVNIQSFDEIEKQKKLQEILESRKNEIKSSLLNRPSAFLTAGMKVTDTVFFNIDKLNSIVYKIDRKGNILWSFGEGILSKPQFITFDNNFIFIADSGNKRIIKVNIENNEIIWEYKDVIYPKSLFVKNNSLIISDQNRVFELDLISNQILWEYKVIGASYSEKLENNNYLVVDWNSHCILEINKDGQIIWNYGESKKSGSEDGLLSYPEFATRIENGNTLIADTKNSRVLEIDYNKNILWKYSGEGINKLINPTYIEKLPDNHILVIHASNKQIFEFENDKIAWKYIYPGKK